MPTIPLVEDNEMNRDMLARRLARKQYDAEEDRGTSGALAMYRFREFITERAR